MSDPRCKLHPCRSPRCGMQCDYDEDYCRTCRAEKEVERLRHHIQEHQSREALLEMEIERLQNQCIAEGRIVRKCNDEIERLRSNFENYQHAKAMDDAEVKRLREELFIEQRARKAAQELLGR